MQGTLRRGQAASGGGLKKTNKNKPKTKKPVALEHQGENRQNICGKASTGAFNI